MLALPGSLDHFSLNPDESVPILPPVPGAWRGSMGSHKVWSPLYQRERQPPHLLAHFLLPEVDLMFDKLHPF